MSLISFSIVLNIIYINISIVIYYVVVFFILLITSYENQELFLFYSLAGKLQWKFEVCFNEILNQ